MKPLTGFNGFQHVSTSWGHSCLASPASFGNLAAPALRMLSVLKVVPRCRCSRARRWPSSKIFVPFVSQNDLGRNLWEVQQRLIFLTPQLQPHVFGALTLNLALYDIVVVLHSSEMTQASEERNIREHKGTCEPREPIWIWVVSLS